MCGIAGIIGLRDVQSAQGKIDSMLRQLAHRGPDAEGCLVNDGVALGHRRLSIIDLSESANQPMSDPSGRYTIIYNGEIYNYREIKSKLKDYSFLTESDTEVILASYIKYGPACLSDLNGMFALAIWDANERTLFVARDRLGVKPFYYSIAGDGLMIFASEIRAILDSGLVERKVDSRGLYDYVMYHSVYSPRTIVEGIRQLPAGTFGVFSRSRLSITPYWRIEDDPAGIVTDDEKLVRRNIKDLLLSSVEMRMISDVRLGAFLSGGIDSSTVVGLMSEVSSQPVDTFSVAFDEKEFDESTYSGLIAKRFNTRHTSVKLTVEDLLDQLPEALSRMDSPSGDGLNTYVVSKATRDAGIKVALSGLGGDELFAGYPTFLLWKKVRSRMRHVPGFMRQALGSIVARSNRSRNQRLGALLSAPDHDLATVYPLFRQVLSKRAVSDLCGGNGHKADIETFLAARSPSISGFPLLSQFSIGELLGYTQNVLLKDVDQFSMASALEVREPFFDFRLVEYVLRIPDSIKFPKYPKSLLVESVAPMLPDEIVHRKKMGFVLPWGKWLRGELSEFCEVRISALAERGILEGDQLNALWRSFTSRSGGVLWSHVWHLAVLEDWLEQNGF